MSESKTQKIVINSLATTLSSLIQTHQKFEFEYQHIPPLAKQFATLFFYLSTANVIRDQANAIRSLDKSGFNIKELLTKLDEVEKYIDRYDESEEIMGFLFGALKEFVREIYKCYSGKSMMNTDGTELNINRRTFIE